MKEDILEMTSSDRKRLHIVGKAELREIKQSKAAELLGISMRQVRRLVRGIRLAGDRSIIHKLRGRESNHKKDPQVRARAIEAYRERYEGFGPTFASEKLSKEERIEVSRETLRSWLRKENIDYPSRRARPHRQWRKRKNHRGEMIQLDGSHHDWLEGRGPWLVLMAYIDDATSEVFARFYDSEDNFSVLDSFTRYARRNGLPCSVYTDRHSAYKAERRPLSIGEQLQGLNEPASNFQRALKELGIEIIYAYSPQAKGRVERLFRTLQDRLVKEMRLRQIRTKAQANSFLQKYLPSFNKKYSVRAEHTADLHRQLPPQTDLRHILCLKEHRTLKNDFTVQFAGRFYQITDSVRSKTVTVETWLDSSLHFCFQGKELHYQEIHPPIRAAKSDGPGKNHHLNRIGILPKDSSWRAFMINPPKP